MTNFNTLYPYVRTLLGDINPLPSYSNDQLDLGIRMGLLQEDAYVETTDVSASGDKLISPDVTTKAETFRLSLRSALAILTPQADPIKYRTPMLAVSRDSSVSFYELKSLLTRLLDGGDAVVVSDNEFDQLLNGITTVPTLLARFNTLNNNSVQ